MGFFERQQVSNMEARLAALEARVDALVRSLGGEQPVYQNVPEPPAGLSDEIVTALRRGRKIEAIKLYRDRTGASLKEAKDFIESVQL